MLYSCFRISLSFDIQAIINIALKLTCRTFLEHLEYLVLFDIVLLIFSVMSMCLFKYICM